MHALTRCFLRARHWQLLMLMALGPVLAVASSRQPVAAGGAHGAHGRMSEEITRCLPLLGGMGFVLLVFSAWLWSVGGFLASLTSAQAGRGTGWFRFSVLYPLVYIALDDSNARLNPG